MGRGRPNGGFGDPALGGYNGGMPKITVCPSASLPPGTHRARGGVLVARLPDGSLRAVENACPHQGYPLSQGSLHECVLTCTWHNFKFDLRTGKAVQGEEAVRLHPVVEEDGQIVVDRDTSVDVPAAWASLGEAMARAQLARISREAARLLQGGIAPQRLLAFAGEWDCDRAEYGTGHGPALAAVLATWLEAPPEGVSPATHTLQVVTLALTLAAESRLGLPERTRPAPAGATGDLLQDGATLAQLVEREDAVGAEALLRDMLRHGLTETQLTQCLLPILAAHFPDFGHPWIYLPRMFDLSQMGSEHTADSVLGGLIFGLCNATREDLLPPWAGFRKRWAAELAEPATIGATADPSQAKLDAQTERDALVQELRGASPAESFGRIRAALAAAPWDAAWEPVVDALVLLGAERMLAFDRMIDANPDIEEGWLDITHRLTVPAALRELLPHANPQDGRRLLLLTGHFLALARGLEEGKPAEEPAMSLNLALQHHFPEAAAAAIHNLSDGSELQAYVLRDRSSRPIFYAHDVKVLDTARAESARLGDLRPLRAAARYLASPVQERSARKTASEALRLVVEGKPPHTLSS